jgi:hypothetical protein
MATGAGEMTAHSNRIATMEILRAVVLQAGGVLVATACLAACGSRPQSFTIEAPPPNPTPSVDGVVVAMSRVEVAPEYAGEAFVYQTAEHELVRDPNARFAAMPNLLLFAAIRGYLANTDFIGDVVSPESELRPKVIVEAAALKLSGALDSTGSSSTLTLRFRVLLKPTEDGPATEIFLKAYTSTIRNRGATARAVLDGWNQALAEVMSAFGSDLRTSLISVRLLSSGSGGPAASAASVPGRQTGN